MVLKSNIRKYGLPALVWAWVLLAGCSPEKPGENKAGTPPEAIDAPKATQQGGEASKLLSKDDAVARLKEYGEANGEQLVTIHTERGDIKIRLYTDTPLHRANLIRHAKRGFYDETMFHRVVPGFVMQGGGTDNFRRKVKIGKYRIPAEIMPNRHYHVRGAVAMARYDEDNPELESDSHEFYIVWGDDFNAASLQATAKKYGLTLTSEQRAAYLKQGGSPHLDGQYTVFGEVIEGLGIVKEVCNLEVDGRGWPLENVSIKMDVE